MQKPFSFIILASFIISCVALWRASVGPSSERLLESVLSELNKKPEVIAEVTIQGMQNIQEKRQNADLERKREKLQLKQTELENDQICPAMGNPKADVVVTQFFDYHCGYCRKVEPVIDQLLQLEPSVRVVFREYPIFGDATLAKAALAAHKQKKYKEFHRSLMNSESNMMEDALVDLARSIGLNTTQFVKDMASKDVDDQLKSNLRLGESLEIGGTPFFIIGTTVLPGAVDLETLRKTIAAERAKKKN